MSRRSKKIHKSNANLEGYVVVVFAEDTGQALEYKHLLDNNDIPVVINENTEQGKDELAENEIAVMVPEEYIDEAHVVIESQQAYDDFYDFALDEDSEEDFDADFFDDEY
ncbi:MAG: hypothetical protein JW787_10215 [Sedimentisphaerales bacterium]|nr:hypothetical protein [Sedimentisphaerales bacterium]